MDNIPNEPGQAVEPAHLLASLREVRERLNLAEGFLDEWRRKNRYDYPRAGHSTIRMIDQALAELYVARDVMMREIREDRLDREERVEELLHRFHVPAAGTGGGLD